MEAAVATEDVRLNTGDLTNLVEGLDRTLSPRNWQGILNLGYAEWQRNHPKWRYPDMVRWVQLMYGNFAYLCVLLGKYHQQVTNGGHMQYWDNGYGGDPSENDNHLHHDMLWLMLRMGITKMELGKKAHRVAKSFEVRNDGGSVSDCECDFLDCECRELPEFYQVNRKIDDEYYEFCHVWFDQFGAVVARTLKEAGAHEQSKT